MKPKRSKYFSFSMIFGFLFLIVGVYMIYNNIVKVGRDYLTLQGDVTSGYTVSIIAIVLLIVEFSEISNFRTKKKKNKD